MREKDCRECRWVAVVDSEGRRRLEMRWQLPIGAPEAPVSRAA
jgi:hypothetical protein